MKVSTILLVATAVVTNAASVTPSDQDLAALHAACYSADGPCTKLDQAISAARGLLSNPYGPKDDEPTKRATEYLNSALNAAASHDHAALAKRGAERRWNFNNWCHFTGQPCGKVKRSASAIKEILDDEQLQKRWNFNNWCHFTGQPCGKVRRSIDGLVGAADEVLASFPDFQQ